MTCLPTLCTTGTNSLDLYADIQNHLLEMSVAPAESYSLYGKAVHSVVGGFLPEIGNQRGVFISEGSTTPTCTSTRIRPGDQGWMR